MDDDILATLKSLNFTEYEAKAYIALLDKSPLSGYAVSLNSGVPRSKIYEVLGGMAARGEVLVSHETPALYTPLEPRELLAKRRRHAEQSFTQAEAALTRYGEAARYRAHIWNITGREAILDKVKETLRGAEVRILAEIWGEEAEPLRAEMRAAAERGVEIIIVSYGKVDYDFATVHPHDSSEAITGEYGGRWVVLSVDDREVVAGTVSLGEDSRAAWTMHPGLVIPITEIIVHDLYIMEILDKHREIIEKSFGPDLIDLRKRYNLDASGMTIAEKIGLVRK